jgi:hypothetical protein
VAGRAGKHSRRERRERPQESHRQEGLAGQEAGCEQADVCGQKISQRRITPLRHDAGDRRADPCAGQMLGAPELVTRKILDLSHEGGTSPEARADLLVSSAGVTPTQDAPLERTQHIALLWLDDF